jgi:VIT1/CCC1 family predicted Fe2+/Mn2+ transporter
MMRFELGLEPPDPARAARSAATIAASYIVGGLIPLAPYILMHAIVPALCVSIGVTLLALFVFGSIKGHYTGVQPWRAGMQTVIVAGLAAAAAFLLARLIS